MDVRNIKAGMGVSALVLTSLAILTQEPVNSLAIITGTSMLLILPWLLATRKPLIDNRVFIQNAHPRQLKIPSRSSLIPQPSTATKYHDEEIETLLDLALSHVLRNIAKIKETCKAEKKELLKMQDEVKSHQLNSIEKYNSPQCNPLIDERLNYLDYHADKMTLLVDKFSGNSMKFEAIATQAKTAPRGEQIEHIKSARAETDHMARLLNLQLSEFSDFNKKYYHDPASRVLEQAGSHLQIIQQTLKADSLTLINILEVASCIHTESNTFALNHSYKGSNKPIPKRIA